MIALIRKASAFVLHVVQYSTQNRPQPRQTLSLGLLKKRLSKQSPHSQRLARKLKFHL